MNKVLLNNLLILVVLLFIYCSKDKGPTTDSKYIKSVEVIGIQGSQVEIQSSKKEIIVEFPTGTDISNVTLKVVLEHGVTMIEPKEQTISYDLTNGASIKVKKNGSVTQFTVKANFVLGIPLVQKDFVISTFHGVPGAPNSDYQKILENTKKANLTHFETTFTSPSGSILALNIAKELGLKVIVQDYSRFGGFQNYSNLIANTTVESVKEAIELYGSHSSLDGYYIWDEPFLEQLSQVKSDMDLLKTYAPNKILLVAALQSYSPTYTWENGKFSKYIDSYLSTVNPPILCFDYYVFDHDVDKGVSLNDSKMWKDMGYIRKKALESNIPFWFYIQLIGDIQKELPGNMTVPKVAVQNYISLAFGVKGISYFNTINGIFDIHGNPNHLFDGVSALNKDILTLGRILFKAMTSKVYHTSNIPHDDYLNNISESNLVSMAPQGLFVGELEDTPDYKYLMVVNTDYTNMKSGEIILKKNKVIHKINKESGKKELLNSDSATLSFNLKAGEGELYVLADK